MLLAVAAVFAAPVQAGQRPIQEFVAAQGTYCVDDGAGGCLLFVPPVANFIGWGVTGETKWASVDYAGLANRPFDCGDGMTGGANPFGTITDGMVLERPLDDGRAEITVVLHTRNALTWVANENFLGPLLFGHRVCDVLQGADASLGDSHLLVVFYNPAPGAPLPDLMELMVARFADFVSISFRSEAAGTLRAAFGVVDGTYGRAIVSQTGTLFRSGWHGATADGFPAELIHLRVAGNSAKPGPRVQAN
jgi:hypothetical protein